MPGIKTLGDGDRGSLPYELYGDNAPIIKFSADVDFFKLPMGGKMGSGLLCRGVLNASSLICG